MDVLMVLNMLLCTLYLLQHEFEIRQNFEHFLDIEFLGNLGLQKTTTNEWPSYAYGIKLIF